MEGIAVDVLLIGFLERDEEGNVVPEGTSSTSTLIRCPGHNIVVDTGAPLMKAGIKTSLKQIGIFPEDVDILVLTHNHSDHKGNVSMFPKAKVLIHAKESPYKGAETFDGEEYPICPGVRIVHTPGHTNGSCSVFVEGDRNYVVAGDACPTKENFVRSLPPALNVDRVAALESLKRIEAFADVVVPGHDPPFFTRKAGGEPKGRGKKSVRETKPCKSGCRRSRPQPRGPLHGRRNCRRCGV